MKDGLLGFLDSPAGAGLLSAVAGGLAGARRGTPFNNVGRAGIAGLTGYAQANEDQLKMAELKRLNEMRDLQQQQAQLQFKQTQRGFDRDTQIEDAARSAFKPATPGTPERTAFQTPLFIQDATRQENPAPSTMFAQQPYDLSVTTTPVTPGVPGGFDNSVFLEKYRQIDPLKAMQYEQDLKKASAPTVSKAGDIARDSQNNIVWQNPLENKKPSAIQEYEYAKDQGFKGSFEQWDTGRKRAGASIVSVNTGQKGLENEMKFSAAFKGEPIYKAHQDVQSAHGQITQALNLKSPAGDLAGATKLMKILDPGSVVRESELALAMAASGALDRLMNYGNAVITGQKLTPTQRADFQKLADELSGESVKQYNAKRDEYKTFSSKYGLDSEVLLGKPAQNKQDSKPSDAKTFDTRPPAKDFKGQVVKSPNGKRYSSDGMIWKEVP